MNILKKTSLSQISFFVCGIIGVIFMALLPDKQWWHWFLIFVVIMIVIADVKEVFLQSKANHLPKDFEHSPCLDAISEEHFIMRQAILQQIDIAKIFMQHHTANGYHDGHSLRLVDTQTVALCTITLESCRNFNPDTEKGRSYDMERTYCIMKDALYPVMAISDALIIYSIAGKTQFETWVPIDNHEWMYSEEHVASTLELDELLSYLRCISGVQ